MAEGGERGRATQMAAADERHAEPGKPHLVPAPEVWGCEGYLDDGVECDFRCVKDVNIASFFLSSDIQILRWVISINCTTGCFFTGKKIPLYNIF